MSVDKNTVISSLHVHFRYNDLPKLVVADGNGVSHEPLPAS